MGPTLPNLLIVGVKKAGTSSLFDYLSQHPDICPSSVKETGYFSALLRDDGSLRPERSYEEFFTACGGERYRMEATPDYFYGRTRLVQAIAHLLPDPHLIVTIRNPVSRLWSHYRMKKRAGFREVAGVTFEEFVRRCEAVAADGIDRPTSGPYVALAHGRYIDYLDEWFEAFGENFRVVFLESWSDRPETTMRELCRWLAVDDDLVASFDYAVANRGLEYRSPRVAMAARAMYRPAVQTLRQTPQLRRLLPRVTRLRRVHDVLNAHDRPLAREGAPESGMRRYLDDLYRDSNRRLAVELGRRGYRDLPGWLSASLPEG